MDSLREKAQNWSEVKNIQRYLRHRGKQTQL